MTTLLLLLLLATSAPNRFPPGFHDRPGIGEDGTPVVIRTALWDDFRGGTAAVEQVLLPNPDGSFTYQYARQSRLTRMYHATLCWHRNMYPPEDDAIFSGPDTYGGWHCHRSTEQAPSPPKLPRPTEPPS